MPNGGTPSFGRSGWAWLHALLCLAVVGYAAVAYLGLDPATSRVGLRAHTPVHYPVLVGHIATGAVALVLGAIQVLLCSRFRRGTHWRVGRAYLLGGVLPSALLGVLAALWSTAGAWATAGLLVGDLAWLFTAVMGYIAARRRRHADHARWMTYNLALTFSAVTFRLWLPLLVLAQLPILGTVHHGDLDRAFRTAYTITTWLAFLPNVAVLMVIQRRRQPTPP